MPQTKELTYYSSFFDRYKQFTQTVATSSAASDINRFRRVITDFAETKAKAILEDRSYASAYNIFDILHIARRETVTHTPFLLNLLNPAGSHSQGNLFYRSFLKHTVGSPDFYMEYVPGRLIAQEEWYASEHGRIDILFLHKDKANPFAWVIENKIDAGDQENQIQRYYDYLTNVLGISTDRILIFYLTKYGEHPSPNSIPSVLKEQLIQKKTLHLISYKFTITTWLREIRHEVKAERVRHTIDQYLTLINTIAP